MFKKGQIVWILRDTLLGPMPKLAKIVKLEQEGSITIAWVRYSLDDNGGELVRKGTRPARYGLLDLAADDLSETKSDAILRAIEFEKHHIKRHEDHIETLNALFYKAEDKARRGQ